MHSAEGRYTGPAPVSAYRVCGWGAEGYGDVPELGARRSSPVM